MSFLQGDREVHRKQRHTAKRVFERLRDEHGVTGGYASAAMAAYTMVKAFVATQKPAPKPDPGCASRRYPAGRCRWIGRRSGEAGCPSPIPAPFGGEIVRLDLHPAPVSIIALQHPLSIYDELMLPGAGR